MPDIDYSADFRRIQSDIEAVSRRLQKAQREIEQGIRSELGPAVRTIGSSLTEVKVVLREVGGALQSVGEISERGFRMVNASVNAVVQSAGETEVLVRSSNIRALRAQVEILEHSIGELKESFSEAIEELKSRYTKLLHDVIDRRDQRLEELDRHVIDMVETEYRLDVEARQKRFAAFDTLARIHVAETWENRSGCLDQDLSNELDCIQAFVASQEEYDANFRRVVRDDGVGSDTPKEQILGLPVAVIDYDREYSPGDAELLGPITLRGGDIDFDDGIAAGCGPRLLAAISSDRSDLDGITMTPAVRNKTRAILKNWRQAERIGADVYDAVTRHLEGFDDV